VSSLVTIPKTRSTPQGSRKEFTQFTTGTKNSALDRSHGYSEPESSIFIAQSIQVDEGKGCSEHGVDLLQSGLKSGLDLFNIWTIAGRLERLDRQQVSLSIARTHRMLGPFAGSVDTGIGGNAIKV
jgi:hypothetical protein